MKKVVYFLTVAALSVQTAWGSLPASAAETNQAHPQHASVKMNRSVMRFEIHPKVEARLRKKIKEVPGSVQKTIGTKRFKKLQTASHIQNFPLADMITFWFLETSNGDGKNPLMFEDETFCENFLKLSKPTIDRIAAYYSKSIADRIRQIVLKSLKPGREPVLTASLKAAILPYKNDACIAGCVLARSTEPVAEQLVRIPNTDSAHTLFCNRSTNRWLVHNWGGPKAQDIAGGWYRPIAEVVGHTNLTRRGFPTTGTALNYRYNVGYYYMGIRHKVADVLLANGYNPEPLSTYEQRLGSHPSSREALDQRAIAHRAFKTLTTADRNR